MKKSIENSLSKNPFHENELNMQRCKIFENFKHENQFQGKSIILQHLGPNKEIFPDSVRILNVESSDDRSSILWFNTKHSNTNRECLFYSITFIPTTSENDNFYRVPAHVYVWVRGSSSRSRWIYWVACVHVLVGWFASLCLCYPMSLYVAVYCCSMLSDTKYQRKWARVRHIRQHYRSDIFFVLWVRILLKIQFYILVRTAVAAVAVVVVCRCCCTAVAGLSYMATPPIFSCCLSALSFSMWNIVAARSNVRVARFRILYRSM